MVLIKKEFTTQQLARLPNVYFDTSYGYVNDDSFDSNEDISDYRWSIVATMPLFSGFKSVFTRQELAERDAQMDLKIQEHQRMIDFEYNRVQLQLNSVKERIKFAKSGVLLMSETVSSILEKQALGQATTLDVERAKLDVMDAQRVLAQSLFENEKVKWQLRLMMMRSDQMVSTSSVYE